MFCFCGGVLSLSNCFSLFEDDRGLFVRGNYQQLYLIFFSQLMNNIFIFDPVLVWDFFSP